MARMADHPLLKWFWRSTRFFERNRVKPYQSPTDRTTQRFIPTPSQSCFSSGVDRTIMTWYFHFFRKLSSPVVLPIFSRKEIPTLHTLHYAVQHMYCNINARIILLSALLVCARQQSFLLQL